MGIPSTEELLALLAGLNPTVAIIPNAWDVYPEESRVSEIKNTRQLFKGIGIASTLLDLTAVHGDELRERLQKHSLVWVMGGNSFYLNYLLRQSGMPAYIEQLLEEGLVYGGESAGAVLACPTLHGVELVDDPGEAPELVWEGLGLVDFGIVPHWGMEKYAGLLKRCKTEMEQYTPVRTLTNGQAFVVTDGHVKLVENA